MIQKTLSMVATDVIIIAHDEDTTNLEYSLRQEGFACSVFRAAYTQEEKAFSSAVRCLINHSTAWRCIASKCKPVIVCEADFVPCIGFAKLPSPFHWSPKKTPEAGRFAWLYSAGSILYGIDKEGFPYGHGNTTVAYILTPAAASACLEFFEREMDRPDPGHYRLWETRLGIFLRWEKGIRNHIPIYQYGEHGGRPNREHADMGIRSWHQADIMWGKLWFLPSYAQGSRTRYLFYRARAWLRGCLRVVILRFFDPGHINAESARGRWYMMALSVARLAGVAEWISPFSRGRTELRTNDRPVALD